MLVVAVVVKINTASKSNNETNGKTDGGTKIRCYISLRGDVLLTKDLQVASWVHRAITCMTLSGSNLDIRLGEDSKTISTFAPRRYLSMTSFVNPNEAIAPILYRPLPLRQAADPNSKDPRDHDFRLLAVDSPPDDPVLRCRLWTSSLQDAIAKGFFALSYVWGDASITEPMMINGHPFQATRNLVAALRDIVSTVHSPLTAIWVDAVCINQCDIAERSAQVKLMGMIYGSCKEALCWLGPEEGDDNGINGKICELLDKLVDDLGKDISMHAEKEGVMPKFLSLRDPSYLARIRNLDLGRERFIMAPIFNKRYHTYWSRVWTFQEVVLAQRSKFITIKQEWCYLIEHLEKLFIWLHNLDVDGILDVQEPPVGVPSEVWTFIQSLAEDRNASSPINDIIFARRKLNSKPGLLSTVGTIRGRNATDARDKLFGVAGITNIGIDVDYSLSTRDLYIRFAALMVAQETKNHSTQDSVLFHSAGRLGPGLSQLPSWVPDWSVDIYSLEGTKFCAHHNAPAGDATLPLTVAPDGMTLIAFGKVLDVVKEALPLPRQVYNEPRKERLQHVATALKFLCQQGSDNATIDSRMIVEEFLTEPPMKRTYKPTRGPLLQAVLRLTVSERDIRDGTSGGNGKANPLALAHAISPIIICLLNDIAVSGDGATAEKLGELWDGTNEENEGTLNASTITPQEAIHYFATQLLNPDRRASLALSSVLRHAQAALNSGHFESFFFHTPFFKNGHDVPFRTANEGYIGYASPGIQPGDLICVLGSYNMPVVLRPMVDSVGMRTGKEPGKYKFVSLCHVMGVMYGEAWAGTGQDVTVERFNIV